MLGLLNMASSDDGKAVNTTSENPLYLHLLGTNRAKHHAPEDWRPPSKDPTAPVWTSVATIRVHDQRDFYVRAPGNRDPYIMLKGRVSKTCSNTYAIDLEYELDDSNMTYLETEKFICELDTFIEVADGVYWRAILSHTADAYDAFDEAQKTLHHP